MWKKNSLYAVLVGTLISFQAAAFIIHGIEEPEQRITTPDGKICFIFNKYVVIKTNQKKDHLVGSDITLFLRKKSNQSFVDLCQSSSNPLLMHLQGQAEYFIGLSENYLFSDNGTGPARQLSIYRIDKKTKIYSTLYDDQHDATLNHSMLTFYRYDDKNPTIAQCANPKNGLTKGLNSEITLNLKTLKYQTTGKKSCTVRQ